MAPDPRPGGGPVARRQPANGSGQTPPGLRLVAAHLLSGLAGLDDGFTQRWEPCSLETFLVTVTSAAAGDVAARWRIDMRTRTVTSADGLPAGETAGALWEIVGPVDLWARVVEGETNLGAALRRRVLRYRDAGDPTPAMLNRIAMLADLLGVTTWQRAQSLRPGERWPRKGWPGDAGSPRPRPGRAVPAAKAPGPVRTNGAAHTDSGTGPPRANGPLRTDGAPYTSAPADANSASHANGAAHTSAPTEADPPGLANGATHASGPERRASRPPGDPDYVGRLEFGPGVAEYADPPDGDARGARLAPGERDAGLARPRW